MTQNALATPRKRKAVGLYEFLPADNDKAFADVQVDRPVPTGRDLLVGVKAVSINPADTQVRAGTNRIYDNQPQTPYPRLGRRGRGGRRWAGDQELQSRRRGLLRGRAPPAGPRQ